VSSALPVLRNFVGGEYTDAVDGATSPVIDPSTGEAYANAPLSSAHDVDTAMVAAAAGFEVWRDATPAERQRALLRFADAVEARAGEIIDAECRNTGKPVEATRAEEMAPLLDELRFFAGAARILEGKSAGEYLRDHTSYVRREPIGVCAQITPWNYPMVMAVWKFAPAIAAGNAVVLKPSDTTPVSTLLLAEIAAEFLPPGVLNVVCGDRDTGRHLVAHPAPQLVSITGSTRAGTEVAIAAAADLKRAHLELGGKAPVIVFDDVDVAAVAGAIAGAGYFNAGQDCTAATRVLVHGRVAADFTDALAEAAANTKVGAPADTSAYFSSTGCRASWTAPRTTPGSWPAATGSASAATSSSRPSWPGCSSATR
jgi:betaine-aldehyde dehydrogenase